MNGKNQAIICITSVPVPFKMAAYFIIHYSYVVDNLPQWTEDY